MKQYDVWQKEAPETDYDFARSDKLLGLLLQFVTVNRGVNEPDQVYAVYLSDSKDIGKININLSYLKPHS